MPKTPIYKEIDAIPTYIPAISYIRIKRRKQMETQGAVGQRDQNSSSWTFLLTYFIYGYKTMTILQDGCHHYKMDVIWVMTHCPITRWINSVTIPAVDWEPWSISPNSPLTGEDASSVIAPQKFPSGWIQCNSARDQRCKALAFYSTQLF